MAEGSATNSAAEAGVPLKTLLLRHTLLPGLAVAAFAVFAYFEPLMSSANNLVNLLMQSSFLFIVASGQMLALLTRGFDLSIGFTVSLVSVTSSMTMVALVGGQGLWIAVTAGILVGLSVGLAIGAVNGVCVAVLKINPFIVTLGTMSITAGLATTVSGGFPIFDVPKGFVWLFNQSSWLGLPAPIAVAILVVAGVYIVLNHTVLGRSLYIIGDSPEAARVAGLKVRLHLFSAYILCSFIAAIGALMLTARTGSGEPNLGGGLMLESIAAAVIGGVSLRGGTGTVASPLVGAIFVTILSNGMNLTKVDGYLQQVIVGVVVILAIFIDRLRTQSR